MSVNAFSLNLDLFCTLDLRGNFVQANDCWKRQLGFEPLCLEGTSCQDLIHQDDQVVFEDALAALRDGDDTVITFQLRLADATGALRFV